MTDSGPRGRARDRAGRDPEEEHRGRGGEQHRGADGEERDRPPHDRAREPRPVPVVDVGGARQRRERNPQPFAQRLRDGRATDAAAPEQREQGGLEAERRDDRCDRDDEATDSERTDERHRHEEEQPQSDRDRAAREDDGPARRLHRAHDRVVDACLAPELLAKPVDDEQRVVDRKADADELDQVGDVAHHREGVRQRVDDGERRRDRAGREHEGNEDGERDAENGEEDRERDRKRERLAAAQVGREDRLEIVLDCG